MTGGYCIMQLEVWGASSSHWVQGSTLGGVQGAKPPKAPENPALYSTKKSLKVALPLCIFPLYFITNTQKIHENPEGVKIYYFFSSKKFFYKTDKLLVYTGKLF